MNQRSKAKVTMPPPHIITERQRLADEEARVFGARRVRYDGVHDALTLTMLSGIVLAIPRVQVTELRKIPRRQLARIRVGVGGASVEIEELDMQISITGLIRDLFALYAGQRAGGRSTSAAKVSAARENGRSGGRPRKVASVLPLV